MKSTNGRPRALTDAQVEIVLAWHKDVLALQAMRKRIKTQQQLARELGVAPSTIAAAIARGGQYKQTSPDARSREVARRRRKIARLRDRGFL